MRLEIQLSRRNCQMFSTGLSSGHFGGGVIARIDAQLSVQWAQISANQAQVEQVQAALVFAQQEAARYQHLAQTGYGSVQNAQRTTSQLNQQQAAATCWLSVTGTAV